ncbi:helix-turn-helix domain-containing protein [Streptomyces sp. NPDC127114]|uniref:helix-turn-helix domain-containing protein n=1 Tax=Streptomyces sp. NPDC127114 TaxID=3345366 RepID=UPI0036255781
MASVRIRGTALRVHFTADDLARVRFAPRPAPLQELHAALTTAVTPPGGPLSGPPAPLFGPWRGRVLRSLPAAAAPLADLVPAGRPPSFLDVLADTLPDAFELIRATAPDLVRSELERVYGATAAPSWVRGLHAGEETAWRTVLRAQRAAYETVLAPVWPVVQDLHREEFTRYALAAAEHGTAAALTALAPGSRLHGGVWEWGCEANQGQNQRQEGERERTPGGAGEQGREWAREQDRERAGEQGREWAGEREPARGREGEQGREPDQGRERERDREWAREQDPEWAGEREPARGREGKQGREWAREREPDAGWEGEQGRGWVRGRGRGRGGEQAWHRPGGAVREVRLDGRGLVLLPTFHHPAGPLVQDLPGRPVVLTYPAGPGLPPVPDGPASPGEALAAVLGRTRAELLRLLTEPHTTTTLARTLRVSNATASAHAAALRAAGLLTTTRTGRSVTHERTSLGTLVVGDGGTEAEAPARQP